MDKSIQIINKTQPKKQIVFIEYVPTNYTYRIAKCLKEKNKYDLVLISFSKVKDNFLRESYDRIIDIELKHKINFNNLKDIYKSIKNKEISNFKRKIRNLNPDLIQITGPDLFTSLSSFLFKREIPRIYFAYDIWEFFKKKFRWKNWRLELKELFQRKIEKIEFNKSKGILHKGPPQELEHLKDKKEYNHLSIYPGCLDELTSPPIKKENKEIHLVYAGGPLASWDGRISFLDTLRIITKQKINFHTYGNCVDASDDKIFLKESKTNKYFHFHNQTTPKNLGLEMRRYDYGVLLDYFDTNILNPLWPKFSMANKVFSYIESGIPLIVTNQSEVMGDIVKNDNIGLIIKFNDLNNLKRIIEKQNYQLLQKNISKAQKKYSFNKKLIPELEMFYNKCCVKI